MAIAKPVKDMYLRFGRDGKAEVHLNPRQKWQLKLYGPTAVLWRDCLNIAIPMSDFEKYFIWYEEGGDSNE